MNHTHISTSKSNRRKARGEVQLYNTSKKEEKTQEVTDKLDHGVFKKRKQESENEEGGANG